MKFFESAKNVVAKIIGFCIITTAALVCAMDVDSGGIGLNGFLSFLIWIGLMALLIKVSAILSSVISVVVVFGAYFLKNGADDKFEKYVMFFVGMGALFLVMKNFNKILDFFFNSFKVNHSGSSRDSNGFHIDNGSNDYDDYYTETPSTPSGYSNSSGLVNGSDEYWKIKEQAERVYRAVAESTGYERDRNIKRANNLADRLREQYGFDDPEINYIIQQYYLDWTS